MSKFDKHKRGVFLFVIVAVLLVVFSVVVLVKHESNKNEDQQEVTEQEAASSLITEYEERIVNEEENQITDSDLAEIEEKLAQEGLKDYEKTELQINAALTASQIGDSKAKEYAKQALSGMPDDEYTRQYYAGLIMNLEEIAGVAN